MLEYSPYIFRALVACYLVLSIVSNIGEMVATEKKWKNRFMVLYCASFSMLFIALLMFIECIIQIGYIKSMRLFSQSYIIILSVLNYAVLKFRNRKQKRGRSYGQKK